ncbi:unnamed protein product [Symbiodinium necroappetens]|uniref:Reverse transcriptase domain-containing protein n=1 Tax=Symbiodinium necroappetens TaxID=1628268 RepID=A0A812S0H6_9DINO|nr:unnamed protein product [Symbiodinium necroappetens]
MQSDRRVLVSLVFIGGAIIRELACQEGKLMALQLGLPNQVPVPNDNFDEPGPEGRGSPKRARGAGTGVKMPAPEGVTLEAIQQLLAQQSATIMEAQRATLTQLEARQDAKLQGLEKRIVDQSHVSHNLHTAIKDLEDRMARVESSGKQASSSAPQDPRRLTLVFGIGQQFDSAPFTTGPRRSVALCNFQPRERESASDTRSRMMTIINAVNAAQAHLVGGEKPLWCSFSRTPEERGRASIPGFVKKVVMTHKPGAKDDLDLEYSSGMSWMDEAQLSGVGAAPSTEGVVKVDTKAGPGWIDLKSLASKAGVTRDVVRQMVDEHRVCVADLSKALGEAVGQPVTENDIVLLQEVPRGEVGWQSQTCEKLKLYTHRDENAWRGVGIGVSEKSWTVMRRMKSECGVVVPSSACERRRPNTKPRVVVKEIPEVLELDQQEITRLAKEYTGPKSKKGYRDPASVRSLFDMARFSKQPSDWQKAFAERKKEKRKHYEAQVEAVAKGEWSGYKNLRTNKVSDWECHFAESQPGDPHKSIHDHLEGIYGDRQPDLTDFRPEGSFEPITPGELQEAIRQGKRGKSVGEDGTSLELLDGIMQAAGGESALLNWFNRMLETAELPDDWYTALMIILPKTARPTQPKQLRPICLSSSVSKVFCRVLLNRSKKKMTPIGSTQCSGAGKQAIDYIHAVHKLFSLEREWKIGLCFLKIDLEKAFDCVSKTSLMAYIKSKIGRSFEARCWQRLLNRSEAHLHTAWGDSTLQLNNGIRRRQTGMDGQGKIRC